MFVQEMGYGNSYALAAVSEADFDWSDYYVERQDNGSLLDIADDVQAGDF